MPRRADRPGAGGGIDAADVVDGGRADRDLGGADGSAIVAAGPEFQVNTYTTGYQYRPEIARAADAGSFVVVWTSQAQDGSGYAIEGRRFTSTGAAAGGEFRVNTYTTSDQTAASVAAFGDGGFVVAWTSPSEDGSGNGIFAQRFDSGGVRLGSEFQMNAYTTGNQTNASVAAGPSGTFLIAWSGETPTAPAAELARRYASDGTPAGGEFQLNAYTTGPQGFVRVSIAPSGAFVAAWQNTSDGSGSAVVARRFDSAGTPLGTEFLVNDYTTGVQSDARIAVDASGRFVVAWYSDGADTGSGGIAARRFASDGTALGTEFRVNTYTTTQQYQPNLAMDAAGDFVVAWSSRNGQDGSGNGVFAQRYDSNGATVGTEFQLNTYTTDEQGYYPPAVAMDVDGDFVAVWDSGGTLGPQDGSLRGIFGQRYQDPCGDGTVGPGEQCDDGKRFDGDCCSKTCQAEAAGGACTTTDGNKCATCDGAGACALTPCTACRICEPATGCVVGPRTGCKRPAKARAASFQLVNRSSNAKDKLAFAWNRGIVGAVSDFGNPVTTDDYTLCVFDRAGGVDRLVLDAQAPRGGTCKGKPCWKATKSGFRYADKKRAPDGLAAIGLKKGTKAQVSVVGQGTLLGLPALGLTTPVTVQLQGGQNACFGAAFASPAKNTASLFKAQGN